MMCFAIKDANGFYWCGLNYWDKQLRKAKLYNSIKWATEVKNDSRFRSKMLRIVSVEIYEVTSDE